jgi:hypothetical protein
MEHLGVAIRQIGTTAIAVGKSLFDFYTDHKMLIETTTAAVVAMFVAFKLYRGAVVALTAIRVAMLAFRASVISTTIAMMANPIGIVILLIIGLVAALVVAYKRSETFRNIVNGVWASIKQAIGATILFLRPYIASFMDAMRAVGVAAMWLWRNAIVPAFNAIKMVIGVVVAVIGVYIKGWILYVKTVATVIMWLYNNVVKPVFTGIALAVRIFVALFRVYVGLITIAVKIVANIFLWLYNNAVAPRLRQLGAVVSWLYNAIIKPVFSRIGSHIRAVWTGFIKPAFDAMINVVKNHIAPAFATGVAAIGRAWDAIREKAKAPVRFVVNTVINSGIIDTYNKIAGIFGVSKVNHVALPKGFARGGKFNTPTAIVGEGNTSRPEFVIPTDPKHRKRAVALYSELGAELMAGGGIIGKIKGFAGNALDFILNPAASARKLFDGVLGNLGGAGSSSFAKMIAQAPVKLVDGIVKFLTSKASSAFGGGAGEGNLSLGGLGVNKMMSVLRSRFPGLPLISGYRPGAITATGNPSWHGKGRAVDVPPRMDVFNWLAATFGKNTKELIFSPAGARQIHNGMRHFYSGITRAMHFNHVHWAYDRGGLLPPGISMAVNNTRQAERVLPPGEDLGTLLYNAFMRALNDAGVGEIEVRVDGDELKKIIKVESKKQITSSASALKVGRR